MKKLPKLNVKLLRKVAEHIEFEPNRLEMGGFVGTIPEEKYRSFPKDYPICRTQGCIAGWAVLLHDHPRSQKMRFEMASGPSIDYETRAMKLLGLTPIEADTMFFVWKWGSGESGTKEAIEKINSCIDSRAEGKEWLGHA